MNALKNYTNKFDDRSRKCGLWIESHDYLSDTTHIIEVYDKGEKNAYHTFYSNGKLKSRGAFVRDYAHPTYDVYFYESGRLRIITSYDTSTYEPVHCIRFEDDERNSCCRLYIDGDQHEDTLDLL